jgi:hypothetical protein
VKTRHAAQIRAGILLARQPAVHVAWFLTYGQYTGLTYRAYRRADSRFFLKLRGPYAPMDLIGGR